VTCLCSKTYLSPKASCRFGMRTGPWPLPLRVLAERIGPKPLRMSGSPGASRPPKPGGMSGSPGACRPPKPPQLEEPCMSTPCAVLCMCTSFHADVLLIPAMVSSCSVTCFSNSLMLIALSKLVHVCYFGYLDSSVQKRCTSGTGGPTRM